MCEILYGNSFQTDIETNIIIQTASPLALAFVAGFRDKHVQIASPLPLAFVASFRQQNVVDLAGGLQDCKVKI